MCLVPSWWTWFLLRLITDSFSTFSTTAFCSSLIRSINRRVSHTPCQVLAAAAMYSASHDDNVTTFCLLDCQVIGFLPRKYSSPLVLRLSSGSLAWSISLSRWTQPSTVIFLCHRTLHTPMFQQHTEANVSLLHSGLLLAPPKTD
jgi:hypothetical protein